MEYIAPNGIKFTSKDKELSFEHFISVSDDNVVIEVFNDIFIQFEHNNYIDSYEIPF